MEQQKAGCKELHQETIYHNVHHSRETGFKEQGNKTEYKLSYSADDHSVSFLFEFSFEWILPSKCKTKVDEFDIIGVFCEEEEVLRL